MNSESIPVQGHGQTTAVGPTRMIVLGQLAIDGGFALTGTILAVQAAGGRTLSLAFDLSMNGTVAAGVATQNSTTPFTVLPAPGGAFAAVTIALVNTSGSPTVGPILGIEFTGIAGNIDWSWDLSLTNLSV